MHRHEFLAAAPAGRMRPAEGVPLEATQSREPRTGRGPQDATGQRPRRQEVTIAVLREVMRQFASAPARFQDLPVGVTARDFAGLDLVELAGALHEVLLGCAASAGTCGAGAATERRDEARPDGQHAPSGSVDRPATRQGEPDSHVIVRAMLGEMARQYLADPIAFRGPPPASSADGFAGIDLCRLAEAVASLYRSDIAA